MTSFTTNLVKRREGRWGAKLQNIIAIVLNSGPCDMRLMSSELTKEGRGGGATKIKNSEEGLPELSFDISIMK